MEDVVVERAATLSSQAGSHLTTYRFDIQLGYALRDSFMGLHGGTRLVVVIEHAKIHRFGTKLRVRVFYGGRFKVFRSSSGTQGYDHRLQRIGDQLVRRIAEWLTAFQRSGDSAHFQRRVPE